jgi:hypothetical protein
MFDPKKLGFPFRSISLHFTSLHFTSLHFTSIRFVSFRFVSSPPPPPPPKIIVDGLVFVWHNHELVVCNVMQCRFIHSFRGEMMVRLAGKRHVTARNTASYQFPLIVLCHDVLAFIVVVVGRVVGGVVPTR